MKESGEGDRRAAMTTPSACESLGQGARIDRYVVDSVLRRDRNSITYKCNDERSGTVSLVELCPANLVTRNALGQLVARDAGASGKFESLRDHFEKVGLKLHKVQRPNNCVHRCPDLMGHIG